MSDDDEFAEFDVWARSEIIEPMRGSALVTVLMSGTPEWSLCLQVGAAVLLDKPLVLVVAPGTSLPSKLVLVADEIVEGWPTDPDFRERFQAALGRLGIVGGGE